MTSPNDLIDPILGRLRDLPDPPGAPWAEGRILRQAVRSLAEERRLRDRPYLRFALRAWSRFLLPTLLTSTSCAYLLIALRIASALYP